MNPDDRLYVLGLSSVNVGRCLKSYAVIAQMTSEEYDEFHELINGPEFEFRAYLGQWCNYEKCVHCMVLLMCSVLM